MRYESLVEVHCRLGGFQSQPRRILRLLWPVSYRKHKIRSSFCGPSVFETMHHETHRVYYALDQQSDQGGLQHAGSSRALVTLLAPREFLRSARLKAGMSPTFLPALKLKRQQPLFEEE